jgi:hypothetical protein
MSDTTPPNISGLGSLFIVPEFDSADMATTMTQAYERAASNPNAFSNWFHSVEKAGVRHPKTLTLALSAELQAQIIDGLPADDKTSVEVDDLVKKIQVFGKEVGYPIFAKTSFSSSKHNWLESCHIASGDQQTIMAHIAELVSFQCMVGIETFTPELVIREMIPTAPAFTAFYGQMPITEEYRVFCRNGVMEGYQPYWPAHSIQKPSIKGWQEALEAISTPTTQDLGFMAKASERITKSLGGYWSVDFLKDREGKLWLIDMAEGDKSFRCEVGYKTFDRPQPDFEP